jgi:hypothetical protein
LNPQATISCRHSGQWEGDLRQLAQILTGALALPKRYLAIPRDARVRISSQVWQHQRVRLSLRDSCWLAWLVVLLLHCPLSAVARGETRHVLVLSSAERPFAPQSGFADAIVRELIRSSREPIRFVEVSVQAACER